MSTNNQQNVLKRPPRAANTKALEKSKTKTDDNKAISKKKDQVDSKSTAQLKMENEKVVKPQIKSNLNLIKTKPVNKHVSSPTVITANSKTNTGRVITKADKTQPTVATSKSQPNIATSKSQLTKNTSARKALTPTSGRVSSTKFFPSKRMFTDAIKNSLSEEMAKRQEDNSTIKNFPSEDATKTQKRSAIKNSILETGDNRKIITGPVNSPSEPINNKQQSKNTIKNHALEEATNTTKDRERNKTRVLSPSEVKVLKQESEATSLSTESNIERPRTATIKKVTTVVIPQPTEENSYDDDFDSYESDFEACTSSDVSSISNDGTSDEASDSTSSVTSQSHRYVESDEDRKLDSGNFDLTEYKHKQVLANIKESTEQEAEQIIRSNLASLSDEGFEEGKSLDRAANQFVNFLDAQKKHNQLRYLQKKRKRGEEILNMIRLDNQAFSLFEIPTIPYEVFIQKYGNNNAVQTAVQTGDDVVTEEVQTDPIDNQNKWTQFPVAFSKYNEVDVNYRMECLGVGFDVTCETDINVNYNENKLNEFLLTASTVMITLFEEKNQKICTDIEVNSGNIPFSDGYILFNTNLPSLLERHVSFISFSTCCSKFLSAHISDNPEQNSETTTCVWKISNPNAPELLLTAYGQVTCSCFGADTNLIYAGTSDGTIIIWDLVESTEMNQSSLKLNDFATSINSSHTSTIISIISARDDNNDLLDGNHIHQWFNSQLYTLDEEGNLMMWSVIILQQSQRRKISLVMNSKVSFREEHPYLANLQCTDMSVNPLDANHVFVSTNHGPILHFTTSGAKPNPRKYGGSQSNTNCLSSCPFSPFYFLSGNQSGSIIIHSRYIEKPLMTLSGGADDESRESGIELVEWSYTRPCTFYTKDVDNNLHIWDLTMSDIFPTYTIPFKEKINFLKLSPLIFKDNTHSKSYLIIITNGSTIKLHILNKEHGQQTRTEYEENKRKFLNYVNRL